MSEFNTTCTDTDNARENVLSVEVLSNIIRRVDGNHSKGAAAIADGIADSGFLDNIYYAGVASVSTKLITSIGLPNSGRQATASRDLTNVISDTIGSQLRDADSGNTVTIRSEDLADAIADSGFLSNIFDDGATAAFARIEELSTEVARLTELNAALLVRAEAAEAQIVADHS